MNDLPPLMKIKVVVVGDAGVGKTSLAVRFTEDSFFDHYKQTVGGKYSSISRTILAAL
jgi:GTPase SAR1 family protein